ncbi:MAG: hypothetical protein K9M45_10705 [Kiritimatiellales bacterium]|nr:hypothetical protein [Kiritimatiellales bacterium]
MKKNKKIPPYHHLFRILHWALGISMPVMIYTGVALHSIARPGWSLIGHYPSWFTGGRMMLWHLIAALVFVPSALISTVLFLKRYQPTNAWTWRWVANFMLVTGTVLSLISALGLLYGLPGNVYLATRFIHSFCGLVILPLAFIVHVVLAFTIHLDLLPFVFFPFRYPKWASLIWIPVVAVVTTAAINQIPAKKMKAHALVAGKIEPVRADIKDVPALNWDATKPLKIEMANGANFGNGTTALRLRAMHDGTYLYVRAIWDDPTNDTAYWPVKKTDDGWKYMQNSLADETEYYEDKLSIIFPIKESAAFNQLGCALSCHQDKDTERFPYGFKASAEPIDVWHWKATRTGSVGHADDKFWHLADMKLKDVGRYGDGGEGGGYTKNINKEHTAPLYLPKDDSYVINNGGALLKAGAVEYTEELGAKIPAGTIIPGVVVAPNDGDRGDVKCEHAYADGKHTLWLRRKLDTGNKDDVVFVPGGSTAFAASAFDHAAKRHAYHMTVYRLLLEE